MSVTIKEIQELKSYFTTTYHNKRIKEQELDQKYVDDTFAVPFIKEGVQIVRTGKGYRMVSGPAEHIITSTPQMFRAGHKEGKADAAARVAAEGNRWLRIMIRQTPQPFKQHVKYLLGRGEAWIYTVHNNDFDPEEPNDMPVQFILLDPLIVFGDRSEEQGVPTRVIISYERLASTIHDSYPKWTLPYDKKETDKIPFFMYYDSEVRYFEAGTQALLRDGNDELANGDGIQENVYGLVPFVHAYSGFGMGDVDNDPSSYAVGRLRHCRDLIGEYTAIRSTINSIIFRYAHKSIDLIYPADSGLTPSGDVGEKYSREPNAFNVMGLPQGSTLKAAEDMLPDQQLFQHLYNTERNIDREDPLGTITGAIGTSGRQQDIAEESSLRRYDTIVESCSAAFATAFGQTFKMIEDLPQLMPKGLKAGDIGDDYECKIELKATDPIENDRLRTMGSRLYQQGEIDLETNLTKYQGYTQEEAQLIMARILADNATRNNPIIAAIMGEQAAREIGMEEQYALLKAQGEQERTLSPVPQTGAQGGEPRTGNIKTRTGQELMDMSLAQKGARMPPQ